MTDKINNNYDRGRQDALTTVRGWIKDYSGNQASLRSWLIDSIDMAGEIWGSEIQSGPDSRDPT